MKYAISGLVAAVLACAAGAALADEGMWTFDHLPMQQMQQRYGFTPSQAWIDRVQRATVRLTDCSGSFVSADGLVMTNHHCANSCLSQLSSNHTNYMANGFSASKREDEPKCPDAELNQLDSISDVTARVNAATAGKSGAERVAAERAIHSAIEKECIAGDAKTWRCQVVTLYHGGRYALYKYRRFQDVRLVFAPEQSIAFFGGDPDNYNFPRYDLDVTFLRAYVDGKPASTPQFLKFASHELKAGDMTFVVGNPGPTLRQAPWLPLLYLRDQQMTQAEAYLSEKRGVLWQYGRLGEQQTQQAQDDLVSASNGIQVYGEWLKTLGDASFAARKQADDASLAAWIKADPARVAKYGDPWAQIAKAQQQGEILEPRYDMIQRDNGFASSLFDDARTLVLAAAERGKPNAERLPAYRDANLPVLEQQLKSTAPVYPQYEQTLLSWSLEKMRQRLGADDDFVRQVLGKQSPDQLATALISGTKLADPAVREALWQGGEKAIAASTDPMIVLARSIDAQARAVRKQYEDDVDAPNRQATEAIAQALFARDGTASYPDATFTPRLSFGKVVGWNEGGKPVPPFTDLAGLYARATGADPFKLPDSWLKAKSSLDLSMPMDFVTDNDSVGGNSGSPVINRQGEAVGLLFDGNVHALAGTFMYDGSNNRAVAVDTTALLEAVRKVYHLPKLADELRNGHN
jgi:hypothetical protein